MFRIEATSSVFHNDMQLLRSLKRSLHVSYSEYIRSNSIKKDAEMTRCSSTYPRFYPETHSRFYVLKESVALTAPHESLVVDHNHHEDHV